MFDSITKYINYKIITSSIKDEDVKKIFIDATRNNYMNWDSFIFDSLYDFINKKYKEINKSNKNILMFSNEFILILFIKDEDFLKVLDIWWPERDENYNFLINKLSFLYPDRFKIENTKILSN